jgi:hypothetical protein
MAGKSIILTGAVKGAKSIDAARLNVVALRGDEVLARATPRTGGAYRLTVGAEAARAESAYALQVAVVPSTVGDHIDKVANAPRVALARNKLDRDEVEAPAISLNEALLRDWEIYWPEWCVSGVLDGPTGCPAPGAVVTVYTVTWTSMGYVKTPRGSAVTGPDGSFTICFPWWDLYFCWPCEPFWWLCWPWWWEEDILHVISALEARAQRGSAGVALFQADGLALVRGQGFPTARVGPAAPDKARTALIARKLANPALREIFPWWWWCCPGPNIVFGATQGATVVLDEDPAISTRWCMPSGENVTLTGNSQTLTTCNRGALPESGVLWIQVGTTPVTEIDADGCAQFGGDATDVAFAGTLSLFANAAIGAFNYYQVLGSVWGAPGFRGGTEPAAGTGTPISANLWQIAWIYDPATLTTTAHNVQMGPFTQDGVTGLYASPQLRQTTTTPPGLAAFPPIPAGGAVFWEYQVPCLMLQCDATVLLGGAQFGAVDLTIVGYSDPALPPVTLTPDAPLTLMVDATPLTTVAVGAPSAWVSPGVPAPSTGTGECPAFDVGPTGFVTIPVTVEDGTGFVFGYYLEVDWGNSNFSSVSPVGEIGYAAHANAARDWTGGTSTYTFPGTTSGVPTPPADCCYEFRLWFGKRVTNGYSGPSLTDLPPTFQTINLKF